ncbi:hypothetical protein [Arthrobacter sp. SDTb3-6]|uniref:hypothetical protein n=1 Tax=Arthrobacter sp. SDTb3-6 TaxID=2713571 RepID=UPI00159E8714|nr:hypothetical protein [Arthrobacter sp. SDTb3-6]NVN00765.1 hypothetical protein [Arthrobacter sp. SDTb3-6]
MSQRSINKVNNRYGLVLAMDIIAIAILITLAIVLQHVSLFLWLIALVWIVVAIRRGINEHRTRNERDHS